MAAQAPPRPLHPVVKVLAGTLVACTLVALWVTAAQIKARKMAARYGDRIETAPTPEAPLPEVSLRRGQTARVGHLTLDLDKTDGSLLVTDAQQRPLARFRGLKKGDERGWQELRLRVLEAEPDLLRLATDFNPGAPCFGAGDYLALRPGLRIELPRSRAVTLVAWDAAKPEARIKIGDGEMSLAAGQEIEGAGVRVSLRDGALRVE